MANEILVNAKSEKEEALNIIIESGSLTDRTFPGVGTGSVGDIKVSLILLGYNTEDSTSTSVIDNKLIWAALGGGATSREQNANTGSVVNQGSSAVLFSAAGFVKNTTAFWNAVRSDLKIESFSNATLVDLYNKTRTRIQRVFFVNDVDDIEKYVSLFLPLFTTIN